MKIDYLKYSDPPAAEGVYIHYLASDAEVTDDEVDEEPTDLQKKARLLIGIILLTDKIRRSHCE